MTNTIKQSKLEEYAEKNYSNAIIPAVIVSAEGEELLTFRNGRGILMSRNEMQFIIDEFTKTIKLGNEYDEFAEESNRYNKLASSWDITRYNEDLFKLPFSRLGIRIKKFNINKRKWSFKCGNCSIKVSSIEGSKYISINPSSRFSPENTSERACSLGCAKVIAKEIIINWLDRNEEDSKFYYTDNLSEQLEEHLKSLK